MISLMNFRPLCRNKYTKKNFIFRSGSSFQFSLEDASFLSSHQFQYFIDFRSKNETITNQALITHLNSCGIHWINYSIDNYSDSYLIQVPTAENYAYYYLGILECGKESIHNFFKFLSMIPTAVPIIYGCSMGKDRTGVVSYLLLSLLNASSNDIQADYTETKKYLLANSQVIDYFNRKDCLDYEMRCDASLKTILLFEELFQQKYLSITGYLNTIGITQTDIQKIRRKWSI